MQVQRLPPPRALPQDSEMFNGPLELAAGNAGRAADFVALRGAELNHGLEVVDDQAQAAEATAQRRPGVEEAEMQSAGRAHRDERRPRRTELSCCERKGAVDHGRRRRLRCIGSGSKQGLFRAPAWRVSCNAQGPSPAVESRNEDTVSRCDVQAMNTARRDRDLLQMRCDGYLEPSRRSA